MTEPMILCRVCGRTHGKWRTCTKQEADMINGWHLNDKAILAQALKDIYAIRGEDKEIAKIVLEALQKACVPGY